MSLYAHVDGIDGILDALADRWFSEIPYNDQVNPRDGLRMLLVWYCERVLIHPRLTAALVARRGAIPAPHQVWTDRVVGLVIAAGLSTDWSDIFIDHLHGFALSQAVGGGDPKGALETYRRQMNALLGLQSPEVARFTV
jgi:hypothetical protein